jgi:hypothetical protein
MIEIIEMIKMIEILELSQIRFQNNKKMHLRFKDFHNKNYNKKM